MLVTFTDGITLAWLADRDDRAAGITMDIAADTIARYAAPLGEKTPGENTRRTTNPTPVGLGRSKENVA